MLKDFLFGEWKQCQCRCASSSQLLKEFRSATLIIKAMLMLCDKFEVDEMFIYFTGYTRKLSKWLSFIPKGSKDTAIARKQAKREC